MPTLASTWNSAPAMRNGLARRTATSSAAARAAASAPPGSRSSSRIRNSSPPWRASRPPGASAPCRRRATRRSSRSPAAWPSESLTSLKLSRSKKSSATARSRAFASATAERSRTSSCARLGSWVSASWKARRRTSASAPWARVLGLLAGCDVDHHALGEQRPAVVVEDDRVALPEPHHGAVDGEHPVLHVEALDRLVGAALLGQDAVAVLGVQARLPQPLVVDPRLGREAEQALDLGRDVAQRRARRPLGDVGDGLDLLDERAEVQLAERIPHPRDYRSPTGTYSRVRSPV